MSDAPESAPWLRQGELLLMQRLVGQLTGGAVDCAEGERLASKLERIARRFRCENFNELYFRLRHGGDGIAMEEAIDAITVPATGWFHDAAPFASLQHSLLPAVLAARARNGDDRTLRIWSAACSTGQEAYGIGMIVHETLRDLDGYDVQILGTDIRRSAIDVAHRGVYPESDLATAARPDLVHKYCEAADGGFRVKPEVRAIVGFLQRDLMAPLVDLGPFDVIFLRNVLPAFALPIRREVSARVCERLLPHGFLVVGGTAARAPAAAPGAVDSASS